MAGNYENKEGICSLFVATDFKTKAMKKDKNGNSFLSGTVKIDGVEYTASVYKSNTTNPNGPKMTLYINRKKQFNGNKASKQVDSDDAWF